MKLTLLTALLLAPLAALHAAEPVTIDLSKRTWQGIPGLERTANGRVFVSWFTGGTKEPEPENTVVLSHSDDDGKTFSAPQAMALPLSDGTRCYDPCLWIDPKGRLWYLFNRSVKDSTRHGVYARLCDAPDATPPVWGAEFRVGFDSPFSFRMNKATVLSSGEWILPVVHALEPLAGWAGFDPKQVFGAAVSTDEGKTWNLHGAVKTEKAGLENMIVELKDGRLWMLIRTEKVLWESHSSDKGRTWTPGSPTTIATPHSRFFIRRLASGHLLLVNHHKFTGRSHLTARLSTDDGKTWSDGLLLDERGGVSYPDGVQDKDGIIWITYDRDRGGAGEILLAKFKEEDVASGRNVSGAVSLKQVVNKLNKPAIAPKPAVKVTQELLNSIHVTPKLIFDPMPAYGQKYLPFAMAASMESTSKGRLWTCWAGGQDGPNAYLLASYSDDQGKSWRDPVFVIDPQAHGLKMGTRLGSFWCDPKGRLWLFFHQSVGMFDGSCSNWFVRCDDPDAEKPVWTEPVYIGFGASINKPIVRKNGEWILPVSLWERWHIDKPFADCYRELDSVRGANVFVSDDEGGHWRYRGGIIFKDSCFNEHSVVELQDGRLRMLSRGMKEALQSFSDDGGKTWQPQSTAFPHVNSKSIFRRLQSGNLLLIRHGQDMTNATNGRKELTAFLSTDDGKTWSGGLLLDERNNVSYPDIAQAPNGDIYVHYDRDRGGAAEILFARFREEDVKAGKPVSKDAALKNLVKSKLGMNHSSSDMDLPTNVPVLGAVPTPQEMRGPFPIMSTTYFEDGSIDYEGLKRQLKWVDESGCPGVIWCQSNDAIDLLTTEEKLRGFEACAQAAEGCKIVLTLGANGTDTAQMLEIAAAIERVAERHPSVKMAIISRPPDDVRTEADIEQAWNELAQVAKRPVIFQTYGTPATPTPSVALLVRLAANHPAIYGYVKEEAGGYSAVERMVELSAAKPVIKTVMAGWGGWQWLIQLRQCGCEGLVTERCAFAPVLAKLWRLYESGERGLPLTEAYAMFRLLSDQRNFPAGLRGYPLYFLEKEGVFRNRVSRQYSKSQVTEGGSFGTGKAWKLETVGLTPLQRQELDALYQDMLSFVAK